MTSTFRIERTVTMHGDHLDILDWLEDSMGSSTSSMQAIFGGTGRPDRQYDNLYSLYIKRCKGGKHRPRYAVDAISETIGPCWVAMVAMEFEGDAVVHEDWVIKIKDPLYAVQFKLMTC
jgi:hypothetical protein